MFFALTLQMCILLLQYGVSFQFVSRHLAESLSSKISIKTQNLATQHNHADNSEISQLQSHDTNSYLTESSVKLSFRASGQDIIRFPRANIASRYLSLPATEYSLLNMSFIKRKPGSQAEFLLTFPLNQLISAVETLSVSQSVYALSHYQLCGSINIDVKAGEGRIEMRSGAFFFEILNQTFHDSANIDDDDKLILEQAGFNISSIQENGDVNQTRGKDTELPRWLIWRNEKDAVTDQNSENIQKSFLQPFFKVDIIWDPTQSASDLPRNNYRFPWQKKIENKNNSSELVARLQLSLGADIDIQPGNAVHAAVKLTPIKLTIQSMISLTLKSIVQQRMASFCSALVVDCQRRLQEFEEDNLPSMEIST